MLSEESSLPVGYLLSDDLIFTSRITGTARDLGLEMQPARSSADLLALVQKRTPRCAILDLSNPGLDIDHLVSRLRSEVSPVFIVAYGSHVDTATLERARRAGCDIVWPRSKFTQDLPKALADWFA